MDTYQNQSGAQQSHQQLDQYGNPVPVATEVGGLGAMLHRSGSSSSSSSEDDGLGGRRKKEKLKRKLPFQKPSTTTTYDSTVEGADVHDEKKGIMEKIKEKLPGHHDQTAQRKLPFQKPITTTTHDSTGPSVGDAGVDVHHEKKGIVEKIKEKLPGGHQV